MISSVVDHTDYGNNNDFGLSCEDLGQIVVTINETQVVRRIPCTPLRYERTPRNDQKKKKLLSHEIRLDGGVPMLPPSHDRPWSIVKDARLIAKFIFKYQPLDLLRAEGIAPARLYKRKAENDDPEADDQARWEAIQNSITLLDTKFVKRSLVSFKSAVDDNRVNDDTENDSDLEMDEARLFSLHNAADVLRRKLFPKGQVPAKKMKLDHDFRTSN